MVQGKTVGIDATTLEANASLRSIARRDTGETYRDFLTKLAQASASFYVKFGRLRGETRLAAVAGHLRRDRHRPGEFEEHRPSTLVLGQPERGPGV